MFDKNVCIILSVITLQLLLIIMLLAYILEVVR